VNADQDLDWAAVLALDALDESERDALAARVDQDPDLAGAVERFQQVLGSLATTVAQPSPGDLGSQILERAMSARRGGVPTGPWAATDISAVECGNRSAERLVTLLGELESHEWSVPCGPYDGWTVRDLVAHVVAVERHLTAELGAGEPVADPAADYGEKAHYNFTLPLVTELAQRSTDDLRDLAIAALRRCSEAATGVDEPARAHRRITMAGAPTMSVGTALLTRTFELWTHAEDMCRALDRPLPVVDADQLRLLCDLAVRIIPLGVALLGGEGRDSSVRLVLSGPGGGAWTCALGAGSDAIDALVVADGLGFCRVAAQRTTATELAPSITGDRSLAEVVLAGVAIFAV
jgi:uncharacterized protein (TIGR03083 family)